MPRSPSRDLSDRYIGRRGYFRSPDVFRRARRALTAIALIGAGVWAAVDVAKPAQRVQYAHSHGQLADVHAAFDNNCEACHKAHKVSLNPLDAFRARDRWHDLTCEKCHAGPPHHASSNKEAQAFHDRCSNCHHDHNGRLNSLVRLADKDCNWCHAELNRYHDADRSLTAARGEPPYANKVTNFVTDHPEFRSLDITKSPRTLTFSHAVHMSPGQAYSADGKEAMTVARLRELGGAAAVARFAPGQPDSAKVQLACASCHALDAGAGSPELDKVKATLTKGAPADALFPPRAEGAYFLPVNFEAHCRSCHPLAAPEAVAESGGKKFAVPRFELAHRKQPADLAAELKAGYLKGLSDGGHPALARPPELGGKLDPQQPLAPPTLGHTAERLTADAEANLFGSRGSCAKCHTVTAGAGGARTKIAAVPDRTVWLRHATFNHASHRGATCATCHPGTAAAYVSPVEANKPEPVQILGLNTCRACHAPVGTVVKLPDGTDVAGGGARHNCTDCHRYHNGDNPLQGRGAAARESGTPLSLKQWLTGSTKQE
ncbi:hypothetical protein GobsT_18790 [Gemmata obscuriglobus]|uniref:Cytochrome c domain-containing protein n=1 Tax=Gemmata obscuriglobus TaxID=114 RepID=A0A2Z3GZ31_9BACT|nr:cytochrome c3 family protein [Gemmata obscuriglobus]AWM39759.1 hypothetical protein C1280_23990 [Gemmata obscuriglobus]QEG27125.1 hypothetical protein GobsT_18790 [Gemmata obscuriglobus]VTS03673.1 cytochrome c : Uncharacterized protein OS=Isosphaera pallida (strain ATCC 43644 / DSM 9630 / IS1B) GN=Isop_3162 PE=4 SV=1: Cytochrome_C7 [Gemmata obscuriglobus UQM 2246]